MLTIPTFEEAASRIKSGDSSALDEFVYDNEWVGVEGEKWRRQLQHVIDEATQPMVNKLCSVCGNSGLLTAGQVDTCNACRNAEFWTPRDEGEPRERYDYVKAQLAKLAELADDIHVTDDDGAFYCPVCRGTLKEKHREGCAWELAQRIKGAAATGKE